jgi:hypothetical protein
MDVWEAIERAEPILPGRAAAEGRRDPRWQAIIAIEEFVQEEPMPSGHSSCVGATTPMRTFAAQSQRACLSIG